MVVLAAAHAHKGDLSLLNSKAPSYPRNATLAAMQLGVPVAGPPASQLQFWGEGLWWGGKLEPSGWVTHCSRHDLDGGTGLSAPHKSETSWLWAPGPAS